MKYDFTNGNIEQFHGTLPENFNHTKTSVKIMITTFCSTYISEQAFSIMNYRKVNSVPDLLTNTCILSYA